MEEEQMTTSTSMQSQSEPTELDNLASAVKRGDIEIVKDILNRDEASRLPLLTSPVSWDRLEGSLLHLAIDCDQPQLVIFLLERLAEIYGSISRAATAAEPTFFALQRFKYSTVLLLISKGCDPNQQQCSDGNTLLHICCGRPNPPVKFIKQLLKDKRVDTNIENSKGLTPLHMLCMEAIGPEARDVVILLRKRKARLGKMTRDGILPWQLSKNAYIREELQLSKESIRRDMPSMDPDEESELSKLTLPALLKSSVELPSEIHQSPDIPKKKLTPKDQQEMIKRLCELSSQIHAAEMNKLKTKYVSNPERTVLTEEQMEEFVQNHYYDRIDHHEQVLEELQERYVTDLVEPTQLTEEDMQSSVYRLYTQSCDYSKSVAEKLFEKYVASTQPKPVKKSRKEVLESVKKLHYESIKNSKQKQKELESKYMPPRPSSRTLSKEEVSKIAARLSVRN